jgi:ElaB/YqjD/DUF883 family membrane-anchored ribosome-binding protein
MENIYSPTTADQARKTAREAQKLGSDVKQDFDDAVSRGKDAARAFVDEAGAQARPFADRAREVADETRRRFSKAAGAMSTYADENTAIVAVAAFAVGLLTGYLVARES